MVAVSMVIDNLKFVFVSKLTGKLEGFKAINTNPLSNEFCMRMYGSVKNIICKGCYSIKASLGVRQSMVPALERNSVLLSSQPLIDQQIPRFLERFVRIHAHGELINQTHMNNLMLIVKANPHTTFAMWTKRVTITNKYFDNHGKPNNLIMVFSNSHLDRIMDTPPKYFDKTFNNVTKGSTVVQNCTGQKCKDCLLCYTANDTKTIIEMKK